MRDWKWYVGPDEEVLTSGPLDTYEEALQIAQEEYEGAYIVEAHKEDVPLKGYFCAEEFIERADDQSWDLMGGETDQSLFEGISTAQKFDLEKQVRLTIDTWQKTQNLTFTPWVFTATRNEEFIPHEP